METLMSGTDFWLLAGLMCVVQSTNDFFALVAMWLFCLGMAVFHGIKGT